MNIAFDWDETVTADEPLFLGFMDQCAENHTVYIVTAREEYQLNDIFETLHDYGLEYKVEVVASSHHIKNDFMIDRGVFIHVWIDDNPLMIVGA